MGIVLAVGVSIKNKEIPSKDYDKLASVNSTEINVSSINCDLEFCDIVYIKTGYGSTSYRPKPYWKNCTKYNQTEDCLKWERVYYLDEELELKKDAMVEDLKNRILKRLNINEEGKKEKEEKVPESITEYKKEVISIK